MTAVPLGPIVPEETCSLPGFDRHAAKAVTLEPLSTRHVDDLWEAGHAADVSWAYLKYGPVPTKDDIAAHVARISGLDQQPFFAVIPTSSGKAEGWASFCDAAPGDAAIEIGSMWLSPGLQRTRAATESVFLTMQHAFTLGYHRLVWRCNALNAASMRVAHRFGFTYEGAWNGEGFMKGRRRDTRLVLDRGDRMADETLVVRGAVGRQQVRRGWHGAQSVIAERLKEVGLLFQDRVSPRQRRIRT